MAEMTRERINGKADKDLSIANLFPYVLYIFIFSFLLDGGKFFSLAKALAKHFEKNENLTFVWIDPEPFPGVLV